MIEQPATVIACDDNTIFLETQRQSSCSGCKLKQGCGTGLLEKHVGTRFSRIEIDNTIQVTAGQDVTLAVSEEGLLRGALIMYIVPLVSLFLFSATSQVLGLVESVEIMMGVLGFFVGLYWVKVRISKQEEAFKLRIIEELK